MTFLKPINENASIEQNSQDEMAKYGITRVPGDYYHYKQYRYTRLNDAIAQAERELAPSPVNGAAEPAPR
jgi:hypothetical protein